MKPNEKSAGHRWWYRHPWLTVTACGILGGSIGLAAAYSIPSARRDQRFEWFELLRPLAVRSAVAAGILVGVLAGVLLVRAASGGIGCPRCGISTNGALPCARRATYRSRSQATPTLQSSPSVCPPPHASSRVCVL